jgi:hypothetical protein
LHRLLTRERHARPVARHHIFNRSVDIVGANLRAAQDHVIDLRPPSLVVHAQLSEDIRTVALGAGDGDDLAPRMIRKRIRCRRVGAEIAGAAARRRLSGGRLLLWRRGLLRDRRRRSAEDHARDSERGDESLHDQTFRVRCSAIE